MSADSCAPASGAPVASVTAFRPVGSPGRTRAIAATVAGVAVAAGLAGAAAGGSAFVVPLALAAVAGLVAVGWPRAAVIGVLAAAYLLPNRVLPFSFAGVRSDLIEVAAFALVALAVLPGTARWARARPLAGPAFALLGALLFGATVAGFRGAERATVLGPFKTLALFLLAVPFAALIGDAAGRQTLERWIHRLSCAGSVITLVVAATGGTLRGEGADDVVTLGITSEAQRLRPSILSLLFLATVLVVHELALRGVTAGRLARLTLYVTVQLISFNRSSWVPLLIAIVVYVVFRPGARQPGRGLGMTLGVAGAALLTVTAASSGMLGPTASAVSLRVRSVTNPEVFEERSYKLRAEETDKAWAAIREQPVTGVGLGQAYGNQQRVETDAPGGRRTEESLLLHNSLLKIWLWLGIAGVLAFAWLARRVVQLAGAARRHVLVWEGSRALAAAAACLGFLVRSVFQTSLTSRSTIFAVVCALVLVAGARDEGLS